MNDDDLRVLRSRVQWVLSLIDRAGGEQAAQEGNAGLLALQAGAQLHAIGAMFDRSGREVDREARSAIEGAAI